MHRLDWLVDHMEHSDTMALWLHRQFNYEFAQQSLPTGRKSLPRGSTTMSGNVSSRSRTGSCWVAQRLPITIYLTDPSSDLG